MGCVIRRFARHIARIGKAQRKTDHRHQGQGCGNAQPGKGVGIFAVMGQYQRGNQRADHRARLVHRLMQAKGPALTNVFARARFHKAGGGGAHRLARALGNDEQSGQPPIARNRQKRHRRHLNDITEQGDGPIGASARGPFSGDKAQEIAGQLARARHNADNRAAGPQCGQIRPGDATHALIGHVGKEGDEAKRDDEGERGFLVELFCHDPAPVVSYVRKTPPVDFFTAATIFSPIASISASVRVLSLGCRRTVMAMDFLPSATPLPS